MRHGWLRCETWLVLVIKDESKSWVKGTKRARETWLGPGNYETRLPKDLTWDYTIMFHPEIFATSLGTLLVKTSDFIRNCLKEPKNRSETDLRLKSDLSHRNMELDSSKTWLPENWKIRFKSCFQVLSWVKHESWNQHSNPQKHLSLMFWLDRLKTSDLTSMVC